MHDITSKGEAEFLPVGQVISLWKVTEDQSNLHKIIAALAISRDQLQPFDYMLFSDLDVKAVSGDIEQSTGLSRNP